MRKVKSRNSAADNHLLDTLIFFKKKKKPLPFQLRFSVSSGVAIDFQLPRFVHCTTAHQPQHEQATVRQKKARRFSCVNMLCCVCEQGHGGPLAESRTLSSRVVGTLVDDLPERENANLLSSLSGRATFGMGGWSSFTAHAHATVTTESPTERILRNNNDDNNNDNNHNSNENNHNNSNSPPPQPATKPPPLHHFYGLLLWS